MIRELLRFTVAVADLDRGDRRRTRHWVNIWRGTGSALIQSQLPAGHDIRDLVC